MKLRFPVNREGEDDVENIIRDFDIGEGIIKETTDNIMETGKNRLGERLEVRRKKDLKSKRCFYFSEYRWSWCFALRKIPAESSCRCSMFRFCGTCCAGKKSYCAPFIVLNIIAAVLHLFNFIMGYVLSESKSRERPTQLKRLVTSYAIEEYYCNNTCSPDYYRVETNNRNFTVDPFKAEKSGELNLFALVSAFHLLSFIFQMGVACRPNYVDNVLKKGTNIWRFVEYSISASIMLVCICIASGVLEVNSVMSVFALTFVTQILGLISEQLFQDGIEDEKIQIKMRFLGWIAHFAGWVTILVAYLGIIIMHFEESAAFSKNQTASCPEEGQVEVPDFVTTAVYSVFICYNLFGITAISQLCLKDPWLGTCIQTKPVLRKGTTKCTEACNTPIVKPFIYLCGCCGYDKMSVNEWVEMFFVILSIVSKSILGWLILINTLQEDQTFGVIDSCPGSVNSTGGICEYLQ